MLAKSISNRTGVFHSPSRLTVSLVHPPIGKNSFTGWIPDRGSGWDRIGVTFISPVYFGCFYTLWAWIYFKLYSSLLRRLLGIRKLRQFDSIRCPGLGFPPGSEPFPTVRKSQLYDRDAGEGLGLYMPLRNAGVRLLPLGHPLPARRGKT